MSNVASIKDFCIERCLQVPEVTVRMMDMLLEKGVELDVDHNTLSHDERVTLIREIIADVESRESFQAAESRGNDEG